MNDTKNSLISIYKALGTTFFTGYSPVAPGTAGALAALIIFWLLPEYSFFEMLLFSVLVTAAGIKISTELEKIWGKDPGKINIDEVAGMMIALIGIDQNFWLWGFAFIAFRAFDIFKPPPIRTLEHLPGGYGVMADDVAAGIYANMACRLVQWI